MINWTEDHDFRTWLPRLQAHRGHWVEGLRQNSVEALAAAFQMGYKMVEFDVRLTKDLEVVVFHDDNFGDIKIHEVTFSQLVSLTPVNRLEDVFDLIKVQANPTLKLNIELKTQAVLNFTLEKKVCALIKKYHFEKKILVSSFNPFALARVRFLEPSIYRALIQTFEDYALNKLIIRKRTFNFLCAPHALHLRNLDWNEMKFSGIARQVPIALWTVNELQELRQLSPRVHGIISDKITPEQMNSRQNRKID